MKSLFLIAIVIASLAVASCSSGDRTLIYERKVAPSVWKLAGLPLSTDSVRITFALKQQNLDVLEKTFWAVSTPGNPQYRNFLTADEIVSIVAPPAHDRATVINYLEQTGVSRIIDRRDSLIAYTSVEVAEKIFQTSFYIFQHETSKRRIIRQMGEYSLPNEIHNLVDLVTGVSDFPMHNTKPKVSKVSPLADGYVVPQTLNAIYNVPAGTSAAGTSQGVIEFQAGQYYNPASLQTFATQVAIPIPPLNASHIITPIPPVGVEGTLDIQYIAAVGVGADNWYWTEADWLYDFASSFNAAKEVPWVVSVSYGWAEYDQCDISNECSVLGTDSRGFVTRVNTEFQKAGVRGVSIFVASGDSGANGRTDPVCTQNTLHPDYPAASPYVTSVGATQLNSEVFKLTNPPPVCKTLQCASGGTETAVSYQVSSFTSGGGFSDYAAQPDYQTKVVGAYLSSGTALPPSTYFNASGRGYPDVAALGHNFLVYDSSEGGFFAVGGTSASSPSFAGYASFLNAAALKKDNKPLGFLNPLFYKMYDEQPNTFRDITVGDNICTENGCTASCKGYRCAAGWDPVTGLGVPDVTQILNYVNANL